MLFIQPWPDVLRGQLLRDLPDFWLVLIVVAQEDIKDLGFGVLCIHTEPLLGSIIGKLDYRIEIQNTEYRSQKSEVGRFRSRRNSAGMDTCPRSVIVPLT